MDASKNNPEEPSTKKMNIFHQVFPCPQYSHLKAWETSMMCTRQRFHEKVLRILKKELNEHNYCIKKIMKLLTNEQQELYESAKNLLYL